MTPSVLIISFIVCIIFIIIMHSDPRIANWRYIPQRQALNTYDGWIYHRLVFKS